ncbi:MAG: hypothetical protein R3C68_16460 [Myxococcota bacterium]
MHTFLIGDLVDNAIDSHFVAQLAKAKSSWRWHGNGQKFYGEMDLVRDSGETLG